MGARVKAASRPFTCLAVAAALLVVATSAQARVSIGQLPPATPPFSCGVGPADLWQTNVASGNGYAVPRAGVITSWSTSAAATLDQQALEFKVFRPQSPTSALAVARDVPRALRSGAVNTFEVRIAVQAGDIIGLNDLDAGSAPSACLFAGNLEDTLSIGSGNARVGETAMADELGSGLRVNVAATVLLAPTISAVSPSSGPFRGGTAVQITGSEFEEVKSVNFGAAEAVRFNVDSPTQITAIAPALTPVGPVPSIDTTVTVTTSAGSAFSSQRFSFRGCHVPKLVGRTLSAARRLLKKSGCRVGKVKRRFGKTPKANEVVRQRPKPGKVLAPAARINLTVVDRPR